MCEDIRERLQALRERRRELLALQSARLVELEEIGSGGGGSGSGSGGGTAGGQDPDAELALVEAQIEAQRLALASCLAERGDTTPRPVTARVRTLSCEVSTSEIGKEEPYLLVAAVDMLATLVEVPPPLPPLRRPAINTFLYGPYLRFAPGDRRDLDDPPFWDLDGAPRTIAAPQDVAFLVALVENDGSSPDAIRGAVNTGLRAAALNSAQREYPALVTNLLSTMSGQVDIGGLAGLDPLHLNADDRIGPAQAIELTQGLLDELYGFGQLDQTLVFTRTKKNGRVIDRWRVTVRFEA